MPTPVSAVVLTRDEEANLPECLASLAWANEVLVVDSFSTDATVHVAQQHGARVVQHPFTNFAQQRNAAQHYAQHDWILFIDADERVSDTLRHEIETLAQTNRLGNCNAYHVQRVHLISGRWFPNLERRHVTPALRRRIRRIEVPRLVNRRVTRWERALHEEARAPEPRGVLDGVIYHYAATNLSKLYESMNYYTDLEAAYLHQTRQGVSIPEAVFRGGRSFVYHYVYEGYLQQGRAGFLLSAYLGYSKFLTYAKLAERIQIANGRGIWTAQDSALITRYQTRVAGDTAPPDEPAARSTHAATRS
ncbi:MAG: glycosyltransferase family 2 protein [Chloroflexaceae bacterium]|nr:glycosyltransferase family 2 protein [Chloroflexaceae bacterium]